ncbi:MAG TPA: NYN domain-containing protein [Actinomycetota bacterium]|nr:NYN domain-containing protein [Actinomycetota bacterium]
MDASTVHIFWDHSNLFYSALDACDDKNGGGFEPGHRMDARLDFPKLYDFAAAGRNIERAVAVGSIPPGLNTLWKRLRKAGVDVELQERGAQSGKEQAVDEALQLHMMRSVVDRAKPAVAVVLSGDGGFYDDARRMIDKGWGVEILCFGGSFSRKLRGIAKDSHGRGKYVDLDTWYRQLVYLQGKAGPVIRPSDALDLTGRSQV